MTAGDHAQAGQAIRREPPHWTARSRSTQNRCQWERARPAPMAAPASGRRWHERTQGRGRPGRGGPGRRAAAADRPALRPVRGRRPPAGLAGRGEPPGPPGARVLVRVARHRSRAAGRAGHAVAHLLDDQARHLGRRDDALRGGRLRAQRPGQRVHPRLRRRSRLHRRVRPAAGHGPGRRTGADLAPAHPHRRAHLRVPPGAPGGRGVPGRRVRMVRARGHGPGPGMRGVGGLPAAVPARDGMELLGRDRRARPGGRGRLRAAPRRVLPDAGSSARSA